jgi:hypothetical protein
MSLRATLHSPTVISNPNRPTVQLQTDRKITRKPTLRKIKRAAMPTHKPTQIVAHLILPNRTTATRQYSAQPTVFFLTFAP